jgi:hypothetical protein
MRSRGDHGHRSGPTIYASTVAVIRGTTAQSVEASDRWPTAGPKPPGAEPTVWELDSYALGGIPGNLGSAGFI